MRPSSGFGGATQRGETGIFCIPLIYDVAKRGKVIVYLVLAIHAIIHGNEANPHFRETDFRIHPRLQIVPPKPGHILDYHHIHRSRLNIGHHFLKTRAIEICT